MAPRRLDLNDDPIPRPENNNHGMAQSFHVDPLVSLSFGSPLADAPTSASGTSALAPPPLAHQAHHVASTTTSPSDYGSDLDPDDASAAAALLDEAESRAASSPTVARAARSDAVAAPLTPATAPPPAWVRRGRLVRRDPPPAELPARRSRPSLHLRPLTDAQRLVPASGSTAGDAPAPAPSTGTPLERFRRSGRLSATDLSAPSWCELQFLATLAKHGAKPQTETMRAGAEIHSRLEAEVHDFRPVAVATEADRWGLMLWNAVQGLRSLRETGVARELRVWGDVGGCLVAGVVDELTTACPDPELEAALELSPSDPPAPPPPALATGDAAAGGPRRVYIVDTKTRRSAALPSRRWELEAPRRQLMLYHALLAQFGAGTVPRERVFAAYGIDGDEPFSDAFLRDMAGLDSSPPAPQPEAADPPPPSPSSDARLVEELRTPALLWTHMQSLFATTLPPSSLSPLLTLSYRSQRTGAFIGARSFPLDAGEAAAGIARALALWRGERAPEGVGPDVEEAFKCRGCEFADGCAWRAAREGEALAARRRG